MADDLQSWLKQLPTSLTRDLATEFENIVEKEMVAPIRDAAPQATGKTKASVRKIKGPDNLSWVVTAGGPLTTKTVREGSGAEYDYTLGIEFGNHHVPSQPFFYSTARAKNADFQQRVSDLLDDKLSKL